MKLQTLQILQIFLTSAGSWSTAVHISKHSLFCLKFSSFWASTSLLRHQVSPNSRVLLVFPRMFPFPWWNLITFFIYAVGPLVRTLHSDMPLLPASVAVSGFHSCLCPCPCPCLFPCSLCPCLQHSLLQAHSPTTMFDHLLHLPSPRKELQMWILN